MKPCGTEEGWWHQRRGVGGTEEGCMMVVGAWWLTWHPDGGY